jgi:hypothetical protein
MPSSRVRVLDPRIGLEIHEYNWLAIYRAQWGRVGPASMACRRTSCWWRLRGTGVRVHTHYHALGLMYNLQFNRDELD